MMRTHPSVESCEILAGSWYKKNEECNDVECESSPYPRDQHPFAVKAGIQVFQGAKVMRVRIEFLEEFRAKQKQVDRHCNRDHLRDFEEGFVFDVKFQCNS